MSAPRQPLRARQLRGADHDAELGHAQLHTRNRSWLEAMVASTTENERLWWRNALVEHNLGLVKLVAQRHSRSSGQPFDELVSAGCLGLIRAVEAFDLSQRCTLSSFAVPYIKGAMQHDVRDHGQPLHTPRRLRELQQRARRLQEQRRGHGLEPLGAAALADQLGCSASQLEEAAAVQRALQVRSLDAPLPGGDGDQPSCLLDQLAAPESSADPDAVEPCWIPAALARGASHCDQRIGICATACATTPNSLINNHPSATLPSNTLSSAALGAPAPDSDQRTWLRGQLSRLDQQQQRLLLGRWVEGLSWSALALELQLSSSQARSRAEALLRWLQESAGIQPDAIQSTGTAPASTMASAAAMAV